MDYSIRACWYVYELIDPRTKTAFYIGKGHANRIDAHEREAAKGVCSKKTNRIKAIWADGLQVLKAKVAFFWDEQAAYDHETDRIDEYGLENLTNILPGGQKAWVRRKIERAARAQKKPSIPLHEWLEKAPSMVIALIKTWLTYGGPSGAKFKVTDANEHLRLFKGLHTLAMNSLVPKLWEQANQNDLSRAALQKRLDTVDVRYV